MLPSLPLACQTSALLMSYAPAPLYVLSYGDKGSNPWPVSSTSSHPAPKEWIDGVMDSWIGGQTSQGAPLPSNPAIQSSIPLSRAAGPLDLLRVQEFEMVRASGNAPDPGTDLVRFRL